MLHHTHCIAVKQEQAVSLTVLLQTQIKRMNPVEIGVTLQRKSYTKKLLLNMRDKLLLQKRCKNLTQLSGDPAKIKLSAVL